MLDQIDFAKGDGLVPAIVQDAATRRVLMLGYMNREAAEQTQATGLVTFWSRSRDALWTKGETSGNTLRLVAMHADCDADALLVLAEPTGPTCHTGAVSCFNADAGLGALAELEQTIQQRLESGGEGSYVRSLAEAGLDRCAQKVGEEAVEVVIAAKNDDADALLNESADLLFHLLVLLHQQGHVLSEVIGVLEKRRDEQTAAHTSTLTPTLGTRCHRT
ncbi:MAG: bifunctional phosphoribosyl-AMP cyclohydrolase/phosphoribosyl-ATP diphosphatase HisIE [Rhodothermaceae bacterium]|nr:bifunctional phosphoribosyl-AMP cyclohydrolase/phosphoribosyl-ATP diphosphatase HisIE [Rhodothermaceae bacterium]